MTFTVKADRTLIRASSSSTRYAAVSVLAPTAPPRAEKMPVNVALVLDRSGSMGGGKIVLAQRAAEQAIRQLRPEDRFSVVIYDTSIDVLVGSTPAHEEAKRYAFRLLEGVQPRGGTDLGGGWLRGCEQVALYARPDMVNRCLLLTDGRANHGITDSAELARHASELRRRGVQTSTFGVGADFDERLLGGMADAGGGRFYFIASPEAIPEMVTSELGEALDVVVRGAALEVRLPAGVHAEPLSGLPFRHLGGENTVRIELGDLISGQSLTAVVGLRFPRGTAGESVAVEFAVMDGEQLPLAPPKEIRWSWAGHPENDRQPRNREVDRLVAALYAARARAEATERNRSGDYQGARQVLEATARRILSYAGNDPELNRLASELLRERERFGAMMDAMALKEQHFAAYSRVRDRDAAGRSRREPPPK